MRKLISVRAEDIKDGTMNDCHLCPIALAIARTFNIDLLNVIVDQESCTLNSCDYDLPRSAIRFIKRFDAGKRVKPFNFYLTSVVKIEVQN